MLATTNGANDIRK